MSALGRYVKVRNPALYKKVVDIVNTIKSAARPYSIYITDNLGGSFKGYFLDNNMPVRIALLKKNLESESIEIIQVVLQRLLLYPDAKHRHRTSRSAEIIGGFLPVETTSQRESMARELRIRSKSVNLDAGLIEESVFYFYHGLSLLPRQVHEYIRGQHFVDVGAYVGDSAIALTAFEYSRIYSLEISLKSIKRYQLNLKGNNVPDEKYRILNIGVASSDDEPPVKMYDSGSAGFGFYRATGRYDEIEIERKSFDWIAEKNEIQPRFIKVDIEGAAMDFVQGARRTLTKFRPVLSIAIYHNPTEFFETKPALEALLPDYVFLIRKLSSGLRNNQCHSEVVLLAYPLELISGSPAGKG